MFERFVAPHYPDDGPPGQLRADAEQGLVAPGTRAAAACALEGELLAAVQEEFAEMREAAFGDVTEFLVQHHGASGEPATASLETIDALDQFWSLQELEALARRAGTAEQGAEYFLVCAELGIVLGEALRGLVPACEWLYDWPYWESAILHPPTGDVVNVFHWAVNKLSATAMGDTLVLKLESCASELKRA